MLLKDLLTYLLSYIYFVVGLCCKGLVRLGESSFFTAPVLCRVSVYQHMRRGAKE